MAVRIAASDELHTSLAGASGAAALCFFPAGLSCILHGDLLGALVCLGIPLSGLAMARRLQKTAKPYKAILYPDSLELVEPGLPSTRVAWSQIAAVRWPQRTESPIILELTTEDGIAKNIRISLESIARQDRALFIAALHLAARQATQENWPLFCFKTAIPHLKYTDLTTAHCNSTNDSGGVWSMRLRTWFTKNPFWAGLLLPITAGCFVLPLVSRRTCWTVATLIASSAAMNIRVVWGAWHQPFTNICLGFAAILFLCGAFAHARDSLEKEDSQAPYATAWLALFVLGAPFWAMQLF